MLNWQSPVSDHWQGKGPDTKLLHDLVEIGRTEGLWRLFGDLLSENYARQHIRQKLGIEMTCNAFEDAFEAEIKAAPHPKTVFGEGKRGNRCAWLNGITIHTAEQAR